MTRSWLLSSCTAATIALTVGILPANAGRRGAGTPLTAWQGGVTITSVANACGGEDNVGVSATRLVPAVFRPRLSSNQPNSALALFQTRSAQIYFRTSGPDQMTGSGHYAGQLIGGRATALPNAKQGAFTGTYRFSVQPSTITASTTTITITGRLTNFRGVPRCTVSFVGAFEPRGQ